jgi:hypothetical protein
MDEEMTGTVRGLHNGRPLRILKADEGEDYGSLQEMRLACDRFFRKRGLPASVQWTKDFLFGKRNPVK